MKSVIGQSGKSNLLNLPDATPSFPNPKYPNRLPNQSLAQRSKQKPRPPIKLPPKYDPKKSLKQTYEANRRHYTRQNEWKKEARESGLILVESEKGDLVYNKEKQWFNHGQGDSFKGLKQTTEKTLIPLAKSDSLLKFPTENDHINPECCRRLSRLLRDDSRAVSVARILNRLKQNKNSIILTRKIEDYDDSSVAEGQSEILDKIEQNMWNAFYAGVPLNKESQYLIDNNLDLLTLNGYELHRPFAIAEMQNFTQAFQIPDGPQAVKITFVLMRLVTILEKLPNIILKKSNFKQKNRHLVPSYVIESTKNIFSKMSKAVLSVERSLILSSECRASLRQFIEYELITIRASWIDACQRYIQLWEMQPNFPKRGLEGLKKKLIKSDFAKFHHHIYLDDLSELYEESWYKRLQIQNLSSNAEFEEFHLTDRFSSELFEDYNYDPYAHMHVPIKQNSSVENFQKEIHLIKQNRNEAIKNHLQQLNIKNIINSFNSQLDKLALQILELDKIEKLNPNSEVVKNQSQILFRKLQFIQKTDTIILPLISQYKNKEIPPIILKAELDSRLEAIKYANKSYLRALNVRQEIDNELQQQHENAYQTYLKTVIELDKNTQLAYQHAQQGVTEGISLLKSTQMYVDNIDNLCNEMHSFLDTNFEEIQKIDALSFGIEESGSSVNDSVTELETNNEESGSSINDSVTELETNNVEVDGGSGAEAVDIIGENSPIIET